MDRAYITIMFIISVHAELVQRTDILHQAVKVDKTVSNLPVR